VAVVLVVVTGGVVVLLLGVVVCLYAWMNVTMWECGKIKEQKTSSQGGKVVYAQQQQKQTNKNVLLLPWEENE